MDKKPLELSESKRSTGYEHSVRRERGLLHAGDEQSEVHTSHRGIERHEVLGDK